MNTLIRTLTLTADGTFPANKVPPALAVSAPRRGGPVVLSWRAEFVDVDGKVVVGGTVETPSVGGCKVQWYSVRFRDPELAAQVEAGPLAARELPAVKTQVLGSLRTTVGNTAYETDVPAETWPWPRVTEITAPTVIAKRIRVLIGGGSDGTYTLTINSNTAHAYVASSKTAAQIRTALLALIDDAEVDAIVDPDNTAAILIDAATIGEDFTVTLASTGSAMSQTTPQANIKPAVGVHLHAIIDRAAP